jgi:hypothetical protein
MMSKEPDAPTKDNPLVRALAGWNGAIVPSSQIGKSAPP